MKMLMFILALVVLLIVLGNSGGEKDPSIIQVNNTQVIERTTPVFVAGVITSNTIYVPMITWKEKLAGGGTICYARPAR